MTSVKFTDETVKLITSEDNENKKINTYTNNFRGAGLILIAFA